MAADLRLDSYNTLLNASWPAQNDHHFVDEISKCIDFSKSVWICIEISLQAVSNGAIDNQSGMVGDVLTLKCGKWLSEPLIFVIKF